jgi:hypothetical protein
MLQAQVHGGLQKAQLAATVVAGAFVTVCKHLFAAQQLRNAIGQLNLAPHTSWIALQLIEDARRQEIAADHRQCGRGQLRGGFFDDARHI